MYPHNPLAESAKRLLPRHFHLLSFALERLGIEARTSFARTLAEAAAGLVCDAVSRVLAVPSSFKSQERTHAEEESPLLLDGWTHQEPADADFEEPGWEEEYSSASSPSSSSPQASDDKLLAGLAVGLRIGAWYLGHKRQNSSLLTTVSVGLATTVAALAGGPIIWSTLRVAEGLLSLAAAKQSARSDASLLTSCQD